MPTVGQPLAYGWRNDGLLSVQHWVMVGATLDDGLHGRVVKGVGHLGDDEAMEAGGGEFDPRPGHYSRMSF